MITKTYSYRDWAGDALTVLALLLAVGSASIWGRVYHQVNSLGFLAMLMALLWVGLLVFVSTLTTVVRPLSRQRLLRGMVITIAVIWLASLFTGGTPTKSPLKWIVPVAVAVGIAAYQVLRRRDKWWLRARQSLALGSMLFFVSSPLLGYFASSDHRLLPAVSEAERLPTVWLLLDETSAGAADLLIRPLREQGLFVSLTTAAPAGDNTLDIVPSLIARKPLGPDVALCGWRMLCGQSTALDMGRVHVGREGVDLIGTYHAWCALRGWRSCVKDNMLDASWSTQMSDLVCSLRAAIGRQTIECRRRIMAHTIATREAAFASERSAPFWREGGDLVMHILLPHLPASVEDQPSIAVAYEKNLERAADYLEELAMRLSAQFRNGFRIVVFSDHPLRTIVGCNESYSNNCERPIRYSEPYRVPVIVAASHPVSQPIMETNLHVFDIDLRSQAQR
jgi:hypothetical protein